MDESRPDLRASDRDREDVAARLRHACGQGQLTMDELDERIGAAYAARTHGELLALVRDLPVERYPLPVSDHPAPAKRSTVPATPGPLPKALADFLGLVVFLVALWLVIAVVPDGFWPKWPIGIAGGAALAHWVSELGRSPEDRGRRRGDR